MTDPDRQVVRLRITGRVQGVGYRMWTVRTALALGLDGWVRNRTDGSVEALAAGTGQAVAELVSRCRQGPSMASVADIHVDDAAEPGRAGFREEATL